MKRFLKDYRLHEHTEALFLLTLGIVIQVMDGSPLDVKDRWSLVWETEFPREYFSAFTQKLIKTVLAMIIFVRCMTSALYVLFGLVVIYCIIKEFSSKLMLPWLFISGFKSVMLTFFETLTGVYVCSSFGKVRKPCVEFIVSKAVELFFATYLWLCIRSIHKKLERFEENIREEELLTQMVVQKVNVRRRRARSLVDETTLHKTANLNYFELKDVPNIIFDMLKTEDELSQDSLLSPGMMLASVSNMGSYDYLKTTSSLGELGFIDLETFQVVGLDDDRSLSLSLRAMKFLKITWDDVRTARERTKRDSFVSNYAVPKKVPENILDVMPSTKLGKHQREEEVFFAEFPDLENIREEELRKKRSRLRTRERFLSISEEFHREEKTEEEEDFFELDNVSSRGSSSSVKVVDRTEEEASKTDLWFMTNRKDEVSRIAIQEPCKERRSDNYERLYKEEFMSVVGQEVFDRESKLTKLTSLQNDDEPRTTKSKKKIVFGEWFEEHTTMPLSIVVTNFPVGFGSDLKKADVHPGGNALSQLETCPTLTGANRISFPYLQSFSQFKTEGRMAALESRADSSFLKPSGNVLGSSRNVNFLMLRCSENEKKQFDDVRSSVPEESMESGGLIMYREHDSSAEEFYGNLNSEAPLVSEQISFIRGLMRKPIRDVLRSYYDLRDMDNESSRYSTEIDSLILRGKSWKSKKVDRKTQISLRGSSYTMKTLRLGCPKTEKLKTNRNNLALPPLYLFGRKELGWSSSPVDITTRDVASQKDDETIEVNSEDQRKEKATATPCNASVQALRNHLGDDSFSSAQESLSPKALSPSICSFDSDESFSLFYSKTADLASPLLDTKRFIYPDHIHYSYKNVKKKGFDVELNGGLPLLVRDSLTLNQSTTMKRIDTPPDPQKGITRRPMDLTFALSDAFKEADSEGKNILKRSKSKVRPRDVDPIFNVESDCLVRKAHPNKNPIPKECKKEQKWMKKFGKEGERVRRDSGHSSNNFTPTVKCNKCGKPKRIQKPQAQNKMAELWNAVTLGTSNANKGSRSPI